MQHNSEEQIERLADGIADRARAQAKPFIVAIDGRSGAGKSTLAGQIAQRLRAEVLSSDDFFAGGEEILVQSPQTLSEMCIDWKAQRRVLECLQRSEDAKFFSYDWNAFDGSKSSSAKSVKARQIVILEGVYSARPELRDLIDFYVLLKIPEEIRLSRLLEREGGFGEWEKQWHRAEDWYFASIATQDTFDVVVSDGTLFQR